MSKRHHQLLTLAKLRMPGEAFNVLRGHAPIRTQLQGEVESSAASFSKWSILNRLGFEAIDTEHLSQVINHLGFVLNQPSLRSNDFLWRFGHAIHLTESRANEHKYRKSQNQ
jgi:hypothetical protein